MLKQLRGQYHQIRGKILSARAMLTQAFPFTPEAALSPIDDQPNLTHKAILDELSGLGDDVETVRTLLLRLENSAPAGSRREALVYLLRNHPKPHLANYLLGQEEFNSRTEEVESYPTHVWMDISSICSVECRFCKYTHDQLPKQIVSLDQIKSIEWLKYVRLLNFTAGTAEAITHPKFIDVFNYIRDTYPHLHLSLLTNGRTLSAKILHAIKNKMDAIHISMNASNEIDYNLMIKNGSWRSFDKNMRSMKEIMKDASRPTISASFVVAKQNVNSGISNLEYAVEHGASLVLFHHYYPKYVADIHKGLPSLSDKLDDSQTLYHEKELSDRIFSSIQARARELNVEIQIPPPFKSERDANIYFGARSYNEPPSDCIYPWTNMYMLWGFKSKREEITLCCGLASDIGVYFDRDDVATISGIRKVWNSPTMRAYRRTANGEGINPICDLCRKIDRFDPSTVYPDQKDFFAFNALPVPPHFENVNPPVHVIKMAKIGGRFLQ